MSVIKGISNFGTPYYTDEPRYERKNGQWVDTKAGVIAELEKIKAEIKKLEYSDFAYNDVLPSDEVSKIFDKHIAELKGENKKECSTCKSDNSLENCLGCIEYGHWELKGE